MCGNARMSSSIPVEGHAVNSSWHASPRGVTSTSRNLFYSAVFVLNIVMVGNMDIKE